MSSPEQVPPAEADQIAQVIQLTKTQMQKRYPAGRLALRGQHAKDHACVSGTLTVRDDLAEERRKGIFAAPGHEYRVWVRYSNASSAVTPDSVAGGAGVAGSHGSRGMAIKVLGVTGAQLIAARSETEQDFLLVNHPVFPFANVDDYEAITKVLAEDGDKPDRFFVDRIRKQADGSPDLTDAMTRRTLRTLGIVRRIQSLSTTAQPAAFQTPPANPMDNQYFAGAPFMFGRDHVMRIRVTPAAASGDDAPDLADPDYLRTSLRRRLTATDAVSARFDVQAQVRAAATLNAAIDIEDASTDWDESRFPFETLATLDIPPQNFDTPEKRMHCEALSFSPWHGIDGHRPLGGINRLRRAVYEASLAYRQPTLPR
jgi:hypothetical protein